MEVTKEMINNAFKSNTNVVLKYTDDPVVSSDVIGNRCGSLVDGSATKVLDSNKHLVKIIAWYDNELGYTCQMLRTMIKLLKNKTNIKYNMIKIFIGVILTSYSLVFWIMDLNLLTIDKNILEYLLYCLTHLETLILFLGLYLLKDIIIKRPSRSF